MGVFYISNDSNIDAERCRISLRKKAAVVRSGKVRQDQTSRRTAGEQGLPPMCHRQSSRM
jgi:hypothetical protein